jgi:hypothetical protein
MGDRLRDTISRLSALTDLSLVEMYDQSRSVKDPDYDPNEEHRKEVKKHRDQLPNRPTKRAFDKELKKKPKNKRTQEARRNRSADSRRLKKLQRQLDKQYPQDTTPALIPTHLYKSVKHVVADTTGGAADLYLDTCPHKIAVTNIRKIALAIDETGKAKYSFSGINQGAVRARYIAALGLLLVGLSRRTGRKGDRWNRIVKGIPQSVLIQAISHPAKDANPVSYSAFNGTHDKTVRKTALDGSVGYLRALKNGELLYTRQAHWLDGGRPQSRGWEDLKPYEVAPGVIDGKWKVSYCRYWILTDEYTSPKDAARRAELFRDWLGGNLPVDPQRSVQARPGRAESFSTVISPAPS